MIRQKIKSRASGDEADALTASDFSNTTMPTQRGFVYSRAANSIEFYSSSSSSSNSTHFSKSEFKFEFSNLIIYEFKFDFEFRKNIFSSSSSSSSSAK